MKNKLLILILMTLAVGCGGGEPDQTWGDITSELVTAYCDRLTVCEDQSQGFYDRCYDHSRYHLCELDGTCGQETMVLDHDIQVCVEATSEFKCLYIQAGLLPTECKPLLDARP